MNTIAKAVAALALAGAVMAPQAVSAESILRTRGSDASDFHKFLPSLQADVRWLPADRPAPTKDSVLPEAGSISALMLVPKSAETRAPLTSQPAALRPSPGCKRC